MLATEVSRVSCPYCGESFDIVVDCSIAEQSYIEDCYICCKPINFNIRITDNDGIQIEALHENS